jgi:drug/metabolite transporter (DMT)-like permease
MTSSPVFKKSLIWGAVLAVVIGVVGGVIGGLVDGERGAISAVIGAVVGVAFLCITAASILFANRFAKSEMFVPLFFGVVMGGWLLKFVLFLVLAFILRDQPWINPMVFFVTTIVAAVANVAVDSVIALKSRVPYTAPVAGDSTADASAPEAGPSDESRG